MLIFKTPPPSEHFVHFGKWLKIMDDPKMYTMSYCLGLYFCCKIFHDICNIYVFNPTDPNVDVIFISPVPLSDETLQYYSKLLGLKAAIDSGNVEDQGTMGERYKIIVPEAIKSFPVSISNIESKKYQKCF